MSDFKREAIPQWLRYHIMNRDSFECRYCHSILDHAEIHIDHIDPVSNGGKNHRCNLVTSCPNCNLSKSASVDEDNIFKNHYLNAIIEMSGWNPRFSMDKIPDELVGKIESMIDECQDGSWMPAVELSCSVTVNFCDRVDIAIGISKFFLHGGKL